MQLDFAHQHAPRSEVAQHRIAALAALVAVSAAAGALGLMVGFIDMGATIDDRFPFQSPVVAGIALALVVAVPSGLAAWRARRGDRGAAGVAELAGVLLVGWIAVQLVMIRQVSFLQPVCAAAGLALVVLGGRAGRGRPA